ncbi:MAG TPA: OmpA family protein [Chitinophagales bacterium]|nr:OmpA family protein [Chitinophagales bacterium]
MKKSRGYFLMLLVIAGTYSSCLITQQAKTGDMLLQEKKYTEAADLLKTEFNKEQDPVIRAKKAYSIGECYRMSGNTLEAEQWYKTASETGDDSRAKYMYALMLKSNEKYEEAVKAFNIYLKESPFDEEAKSEVEACTLAMEWKKADSKVSVAGVDALNSVAFDYAPALYGKNGMVFTSDRGDATGSETYGWTGEKYSDLYVAYKDANGKFGAPVLFSDKINSNTNEGAACFNKDFTECYFTRCIIPLQTKDTTAGYCHIFYTYRTGDEWSDPTEVSIFNDSCNVKTPFLSSDGKELYVSSDVDGGYGAKDLYVLTKNTDGNWSNPQNLGPNINTPGEEAFPQLSADGKLYFASNGQEGMGGLDIFSAARINKQWNNVQNMRSPINSGADDFALVFEKVKPEDQYKIKSQGYFVSNRQGGKGKDDIYFFSEEKRKVFLVKGNVTEKKFTVEGNPNSGVVGFISMPSIDVAIVTLDEQGNPMSKTQRTVKSDAKGRFQFLSESDKTYKVSASKLDYFTKSEIANTNGFQMQDKDTVVATVQLVLDKIYRNIQVNISNIYYDYNKWNIRPDAAKVLDTLVNVLKENPNVKVEIGSHTDSRGKDPYNMNLSLKRAQSVVEYLVQHGIDASLLSAKGYGETQPVNKCTNGVKCTEEEFQANRRTTFKVTSATFSIESTTPEKIEVDSSMIKK